MYQAATRLFDPRKGGSMQVFRKRPLEEDIRAYCVHSLQYLLHLHKLYWDRLSKLRWRQEVADQTGLMIQLSQSTRWPAHGLRASPKRQTWRLHAVDTGRRTPFLNSLHLAEPVTKTDQYVKIGYVPHAHGFEPLVRFFNPVTRTYGIRKVVPQSNFSGWHMRRTMNEMTILGPAQTA